MAKLNEKQKLFAKEYLIDRNATKAAERAGYSKKTSGSQGTRLLQNAAIQQEISKGTEKIKERTNITQDRVVKEIAKVAFADIGLVCDWDANGKLTLKSREDMGPEGLAALNMIQSVDSYDKEGNLLGTKNSFKLNDKLKALELLSKHLGMLDGSGAEKTNNKSALGRLQGALSKLGSGRRSESDSGSDMD